MKIAMICGSPRLKGSNSMFLLESLQKKLAAGHEISLYHAAGNKKELAEEIVRSLWESDLAVFAFPLYVDSIPSHLLGIMSSIETAMAGRKKDLTVSVIVNNGFYDARQNSIAIEVFWHWCGKCGFQRWSALGVGAGEMAQMAPLGQGPSANLGKALDQFAADLQSQKSGGAVFTEPNFPRFLYLQAAHMGWRRGAKKNGLKAAALKRRPF